MANEKGPNIKKKQKCKKQSNPTMPTAYHTPFTNFIPIAFHGVLRGCH